MVFLKLLKRYHKNLIEFYREYTKNLWDEIASKNTIISLLAESINNLSRLHSQSETCYQPQKHNKAQNTQVLLDDQQKKTNYASPPLKI